MRSRITVASFPFGSRLHLCLARGWRANRKQCRNTDGFKRV
jgi:hypothetical protein